MLLVNIALPTGLKYNDAKEKIQNTLRGSVGYAKGSIRIRPISGHSDHILLEIGDAKDTDIVVNTTASQFFERQFTMTELGTQPEATAEKRETNNA